MGPGDLSRENRKPAAWAYLVRGIRSFSATLKLTIKEEGQVVPLESTLEIQTRVFHKPLEIQDVAPQLWVSQTFKLVRAYHRKGTFQGPEVEDVTALIKRWEERNQNRQI